MMIRLHSKNQPSTNSRKETVLSNGLTSSRSYVSKFAFSLLISFAVFLWGKGSVWGQASSANYTFATNATGSLASDMNSNSIDMSAGTIELINAGRDAVPSGIRRFPGDFKFWLMGTEFSNFSVTEDGIVQLGNTFVTANNYNLTTGTLTLPKISAFNADLRTGTGGKVHYKIVGTAPNRCLVIEFNTMQLFYNSTTTTAGASTWQVRLYESSGIVEFVYGAMSCDLAAASNNTPSVGFYTGATANSSYLFVNYSTHTASISSTTANAAITATGVVTNLNSSANGSRRVYLLTPSNPSAPSGLNVTSLSSTTCTLNWTDNSNNEASFVVYQSTDDVNYTLVNQPAANATSYNVTGLQPSTKYFWKVFARRENLSSTSTNVSATTTSSGATITYSTFGTYTFKVPAGVCSVNVNAWGAGGAGGNHLGTTARSSAGGGGGGAFAGSTAIAVTPGSEVTVTVGRGGIPNVAFGGNGENGGSSSFNSTTVVAAGGTGGAGGNAGAGGTGGTTASSTGTTKWAGGIGGTGAAAAAASLTGAGAGSAGTGANGNFTIATTSGTAATLVTGGVAGVAGVSTGTGNVGTNGLAGGGGGSGSKNNNVTVNTTLNLAGTGGDGKVVITWTALSGTSATPVVTSPICVSATSVSGTSSEANGTIIEVFNGASSLGTTTVTSSAWTLSSLSALASASSITAKASACGKNVSTSSTAVVVGTSAAPAITGTYCPGATTVSGTGVNGSTISVIRGGSSIGTATVSSGTWSATVSTLAAADVLTATQTESGKCESSASSSNTVQSISTAPSITGTYCPGNTTVTGTGVAGASISVIRSGSSIGTATVAVGGTWSATVSTLAAADVLTATQTESGKCVSSASSSNTVQSISTAPSITGTYCPGGTTVTGTGVTGSTISVIRGGSSIGTATVSGGTWSATVSTLAASDVLTATQTESGKCVSAASGSNTVQSVSAAPVITGPICPGNTTVSGTGVNGSTIKVIRGGSEIQSGSATWSGTSWSITVSSVSAGNSLTATQTESGKCVSAASAAYVVITPPTYSNLQWPPTANICGSTVTVYGRVYGSGITDGGTANPSLSAQLGWGASGTNPNTWTNWTGNATFGNQYGNDDEYSITFGAGLTTGSYDYAFRYDYSGCIVYGGYSGGGGGIWNGTTNVSGQATVPASQTATLSSSVGTNAQTVCKGTAITNITYTLGNGANNANVTGLPTGVSASVSGTTLTISGSPSVSGNYTYSVTTSGTSNCAFSFTGTITVSETLDWANLQFPSTAAICVGGNASIYGKVYESGVTEAAGAGSGITAQYGYSSTNSDPSGGSWTWGSASFNGQQISDDEFVGTFGSSLTAGTYYYTMRFTYNGCTIYGGFNAGPWNGSTNVNGTLTVNALPAITGQPTTPSATCSGSGTQTMTVTATGAGLGYQWRKGGVNISNGGVFGGATTATLTLTNPTTSDAGSYDCLVSGTCTPSVTSNAVTVSVTAAPTAVAGTAITTCSNSGAVNITTGSSSTNSAGVTWTSNGGGTFANATSLTTCTYTPNATDITAGSITLTLTATGNGTCANATSTKTLTINAAPSAPTASNNSRCGTGTVAISASSSGAVIDWYAATSAGLVLTTGTPNPASSTNNFTTPSIAATTIYYVEARNASTGCLSSSRTAVTATVNATPTVTFTAQPGASTCSSNDLTYTTQSGQSNYAWTFPGTLNTDYTITSGGTSSYNTVVIKYLTSGSKTVSVNYTSGGCSAASATSSNATVVSITPNAPSGSNETICNGVSTTLTASSSGEIKWYDDLGNLISNGSNLVVSPTSTTTYYAVSQPGTVNVVPYPASSTFTVPTGVDQVKVEAWGAGGSGGAGRGSTSFCLNCYSAGGGGGGGAFQSSTYNVSASQVYTLTVGSGVAGTTTASGAAGGNTVFSGPAGTLTAAGGAGGLRGGDGTSGAGGAGGVGLYNGGNGASGDVTGTYNNGGGGGGGAGNAGAGSNANLASDASGGPGGSGGAGSPNNLTYSGGAGGSIPVSTLTLTGVAGSVPGGGGSGGAGDGANRAGGTGGNGRIVLTYTSFTGCASSSTPITVTVNARPSTPTASVSGSSTINVGGTTTLTSSAGANTLWYEAASGGSSVGSGDNWQTPVECVSGTKTYYAEDNNGTCASPSRTAVSFTVRPMVVSNPANGLICQAGGSVTLSSQLTGGSSISWSPNTNLSTTSAASTVASPSTTTVYTMSATVAGCSGSVTAQQTVGVIDAVDFTPTSSPTAVCAGNTAALASNLSSSNFSVGYTSSFSPNSLPGSGVNYLFNGSSATYLTLSGGSLDDGGWANIPIGFSYNFFGSNFSSLAVGTNGLVMFGTVPGYTTSAGNLGQYSFNTVGGAFPNANNPGNIIALIAHDVYLAYYASSTAIRYWTTGISPTRKFVLEFIDVPDIATGAKSTAQLVLNETTGNVEIYVTSASAASGTSAKIIGLQNGAKTIGAVAGSNNNTPEWNYRSTVASNLGYKFVPGANYSFQWSTAGSNIDGATSSGYTTPTLSTAGTVSYSVAATNPNTNCTTTKTVDITVNALPTAPVSAGNVTECGNAANQNLVVSVGTGETADWYGASSNGSVLTSPSNGTGVTSYSVPANATATYYAEARNTTTGCVSSSRTAVTYTTKPVPIAPTASAVSYCQGATSSAMTASTPVGSNTQNWYSVSTGGTPLAGAPTPSTATATTLTYYVAEVGTNGCESSRTSVTATISATPSAPSASNPSAYCQNASASALTATAGVGNTLYWYTVPTGGSGSTTAITPSTSTAGNTDYYVAQRSASNCESSRATITVTVNPNITASVSNSASSTSACGGGAITFTATPTNGGTPTYQWYLNGATVGTNSSTYELASPANNDQIYVAMTPSAQTCLTSTSATNSSTISLTSSASTPTVAIQSSAIAAICPGTSVTFSVNSSANMGATPSYVWKLNGSPISGATNPTYTSTGLINNDQITLEMTSSLNGLCVTQSSASSSAITTTVNTATSITSQPVATSACASSTANFTVTGVGQGTLTYQWKKNTVNITGNGTATSSSLTLSGVGAGDVADYTVVVTGACGNVTSNTAAFTINTPTSISVHPAAVTTCTNNNANFSVTAAGQGTLTYQWTFGGTPITNATSSTYTATAVTSANAGNYRVNVTGGCGTLASNQAALSVQPATVISTQPTASTLCQNNTANFSVSATGQGTLSYQWKRDGTNVGTNSSSLAVSNAQSINAGSYTVDVTGSCGTTTSNAAVLTVNPATSITTQPVGTAGCEGQNTTFTVVAAGTGSLSYQWKYGATNVGTNSASYNIPSTSTANDGNYSVVVTGGCGNATSSTVALNVYASPTTNATISTADITDATLCGKNSASVVGNAPGNDSQGEWSVVGGFNIVVDDPGSTSATFTVQDNSLLGGATRKFVWAHVRTTSGNNCYTRDTITVDFKQPTITEISALVQNGDVLWNGLTNSSWSTSSNWYQYAVSNSVGRWIRMTSGEPTASTKVYTLSNGNAGVCVNSTNAPALGNGELASNVYVGDGATLNLSSGTLTIAGDLTNNGTINPSSGTITFNGTGAQKITGTGIVANFNNLIVNKASGSLTLEQPAKVAGTLTMTQGDIITDATNILEVGTNASSVGSVSWTAGTVRGPMKRWFAASINGDQASGIFPVGGNISTINPWTGAAKGVLNRYAQVNFTSAPSNGGYIIAKYVVGNPGLTAGLPIWTPTQYIQNFEEEGYWDITPYDASGDDYAALNSTPYTLKLRLNTPSTNDGSYITAPERIRIISSKGPAHNTWVLAGTQGAGQSQTSTGDYLLEETGVTGFSWFNGGGDNFNPLPVELTSFTGVCDNGIINLTWQTASEFNSSHFDVEKSRDGENWQLLTKISSAGTSNELITYQSTDQNGTEGNNYFRLRQVDIDGTEKLYDPINVSCSEVTTGYFSSFPNPSGSAFQVIVNNKELVGVCTMNIVDASGKVIEQREIEVKDGINMFVINQELTPGMYFLNISNGSKSTPVLRHAIK